MHNIKFSDKDHFKLPGSWNEMTTDQLRYLVRLTAKDTPVEEVKTCLMLYCMNAIIGRHSDRYNGMFKVIIRGLIFRRSYLLTAEQIAALSDLFRFLTKRVDKEGNYCINPRLTVNPYPQLHIRGKRFYGPDDGLVDLTYEQFALVQHYHDSMKDDPGQIDHLLAVLFHRKKEFTPDDIEADTRIIKHLHPEKKMLLYWFYLGSIQWLADLYPRVFSGGGGAVIGNVYESQLRVIDMLAGSDMTKKPAVRKGLLLDALVSMEETIRRQEEAEERNHSKR